MDIADRGRLKMVERILGDPELYPDALKSWLPRFLEGNVNLQLRLYQLPTVESTHYVGASGQPVFVGAWVNYGAPNETAGFYKDPFGHVFLTGLVKSGSSGTTIFSLPGAYRPKNRESFIVVTGSPDAIGRIDVASNGDVIHISGSTGYVQLSGINFRAF